jgi:site-specific recombinase XerD
MSTVKISEIDGSIVTLELDKGFSLSVQRETTEGTAITVEYAGRRIALRQRSRGSIEAEGDHSCDSRKPRTGARTLADAIEWAARELHKVVRSVPPAADLRAQPPVSGPHGLTLAQARHVAYEKRVWAHTSRKQQKKYQMQLDVLLALHGPDKRIDVPWSQSDVDLHFAARAGTTRNGRDLSSQELSEYGLQSVGIRFPAAYGRRSLKRVKPITVRNELNDLAVLFRYLKRQSVDGVRVLLVNPLEDLDFGSAVRDTRADYHPDRFRWLLAVADHVDSTGQLRLMIVLAFLTAHRIDAVLSLEMQHIGLTEREVRALLRRVRRTHETEPTASEMWAKYFNHGALYWILERDKERFDRVIPISERVRSELYRYMTKRSAMLGSGESPWLFPAAVDVDRRVSYRAATALLREAEAVARPQIAAAGLDPDEIMPETPGDAWHPARGWWEARRAELLWEGNRNSAYVGGWTTNTGAVQSTVYGELNPQLMQACAEGWTLQEAAEELGLVAQAKAALESDEPVLVALPEAA